jgi:hypothetical protein
LVTYRAAAAVMNAPPHPIRETLGWRSLNEGSVHKRARSLLILSVLLLPVLAIFVDHGPGLPPAFNEIFAANVTLVISAVILSLLVRRSVPAEDRQWLAGLCRTAFFLRVLVATIVFFGPWDFYLFGEDQMGYDHLPIIVAKYWHGDVPFPPWMSEVGYQERLGYYTLVSSQYYLLGPSFMMPRILNCLAGGLIVLCAYRLARHVFGPAEAKVAAVWTAYFPSLVLWSSLNMRDIWLALGVIVVVYHTLLLRERITTGSVVTIVVNLLWIHYNRPPLVLILVGAMAAILWLARSQSLARDLFVAALFVGVIVFFEHGLGVGQQAMEWLDLERIAAHRGKMAQASVGASGYLGDVDVSSPALMIGFLPLSLAYFLFSPFPWQMTVPRRLITLPEMVMWYWSVPFGILAARQVFRERGRKRLALLLPTLMITVAFAVGSSNIGLSYRYRAQVVALYLCFAAAGYVQRRAPALASPAV